MSEHIEIAEDWLESAKDSHVDDYRVRLVWALIAQTEATLALVEAVKDLKPPPPIFGTGVG